jgi:hypothetical protein
MIDLSFQLNILAVPKDTDTTGSGCDPIHNHIHRDPSARIETDPSSARLRVMEQKTHSLFKSNTTTKKSGQWSLRRFALMKLEKRIQVPRAS